VNSGGRPGRPGRRSGCGRATPARSVRAPVPPAACAVFRWSWKRSSLAVRVSVPTALRERGLGPVDWTAFPRAALCAMGQCKGLAITGQELFSSMLNEEGGDGRGSWLPSFPRSYRAWFGGARAALSERVVGGRRPVLAETPEGPVGKSESVSGMLEMCCRAALRNALINVFVYPKCFGRMTIVEWHRVVFERCTERGGIFLHRGGSSR